MELTHWISSLHDTEFCIGSSRFMNSPCTWDLDKYEEGDFIAHYAEEHSLDKYERLALKLATMNL